MAVEQPPGRVDQFAHYLTGLVALLDRGGGWYAVFWQRDPEGMRACLDGREIPPWDVVEALLRDFAARYAPAAAAAERERALALHAAALTAYDARPGARKALEERLALMLGEQRRAAGRRTELSRLLAAAPTREAADTLRRELAWTRDDHERATARVAELRGRLARLTRPDGAEAAGTGRRTAGEPGAGGGDGGPAGSVSAGPAVPTAPEVPEAPDGHRPGGRVVGGGRDGRRPAGREGGHPGPGTAVPPPATATATATASEAAVPAPSAAAHARRRKRGSARFAGLADEGAAPVVAPDIPELPARRKRGSARFAGQAGEDAAAVPDVPGPPPPDVPASTGVPVAPRPAGPARPPGRTPRGARFAGAVAAEPGGTADGTAGEAAGETAGAGDRHAVGEAVQRLTYLRGAGRGGEAHALLAEAAWWPSVRLPLFADALHEAGLGADWATLLWEAAALPADRLVDAADALAGAGRADDGERILRQGVARPADEIGQCVLDLADAGRHRAARVLLGAYVRVRTPEQAARSVAPDPPRLVPLLLEAALGVSDERHWDLVHALRVAGLAA